MMNGAMHPKASTGIARTPQDTIAITSTTAVFASRNQPMVLPTWLRSPSDPRELSWVTISGHRIFDGSTGEPA